MFAARRTQFVYQAANSSVKASTDHSQVAYLFLLRLLGWLGSLHEGTTLKNPPLTGSITLIGNLGPQFTTTPPLANLAYGSLAPSGGSLVGVTPSLTTVTWDDGASRGTATKLVTWVPTALNASPYDPVSATASANAAVSQQLYTAVGTQGGPTARCIGSCPNAGTALAIPASLWLLGGGVAVGMILAL